MLTKILIEGKKYIVQSRVNFLMAIEELRDGKCTYILGPMGGILQMKGNLVKYRDDTGITCSPNSYLGIWHTLVPEKTLFELGFVLYHSVFGSVNRMIYVKAETKELAIKEIERYINTFTWTARYCPTLDLSSTVQSIRINC